MGDITHIHIYMIRKTKIINHQKWTWQEKQKEHKSTIGRPNATKNQKKQWAILQHLSLKENSAVPDSFILVMLPNICSR